MPKPAQQQAEHPGKEGPLRPRPQVARAEYRGSGKLQALAERGIRVNAVAPGPIWTPLIPSTFPPEKVERFGADVPLQRAGEPMKVAPCYVFLASDDGRYLTGQVLHPNGGVVVNG